MSADFMWTTTAASPIGNYTINIPTTIIISGSAISPNISSNTFYNPLWSIYTTGSGDAFNPTPYGRWVPGTGSTWWEEHIPNSRIPVFNKKTIYQVNKEYARPYELYDWIKLNMMEKEGLLEWKEIKPEIYISGSWV
jgi:hypothetical protein